MEEFGDKAYFENISRVTSLILALWGDEESQEITEV
jgi:hypothetical protein